MNAYKKLTLEYNGIFGTIDQYTSDSNVMNYLSQLKEGIEEADYDKICYCLDELEKWYEQNINKIAQNHYVSNLESHKKNMALIKEVRKSISIEDCKVSHTKEKNNKPIVFISHKSCDKKYGDALRDLLVGLGLKDDQIIYTSHPLNKIPLDANIYDYLRQNIHSNIFMIVLWSDEYLNSPACLNEMGAAWVTMADYTNIYVPNFSFGNPKYHECAVDTRKMGAVLNGDSNCKAAMIELKNKIQKLFCLVNDEQKSVYLLDEFLKRISEE